MKKMGLDTEGFDLAFGLMCFLFGGVIMQRDGVSHAGKGQGEGFAKPLCAAGDKGKGLGHGGIVNEKAMGA